MDLDDFLEPEVAIAVAVTAVVATPTARRALRSAAVYGLAGLMIAKDKIAAITRGAAEGAQEMAASATDTARETSERRNQIAGEPATT